MKFKSTLVMTSLALMLAACGGGGGEITETPKANHGNAGLPGPGDFGYIPESGVLREVPAPNYAASSHNLAAFNAINAFRASVGLGLWVQDSRVDLMAQNHANYLALNNLGYSGDEKIGLDGYTGSRVDLRVKSAGITGGSPQFYESHSSSNGAQGIAEIINSIYHRGLLLNDFPTLVGISNSTVQIINFGSDFERQYFASDFLGFYPVSGQVNVPLKMTAEVPNQVPEIVNPSSPVSFFPRGRDSTLTVTLNGVLVPGKLIYRGYGTLVDTDESFNSSRGGLIHFVGNEPFLPNSVYHVKYTGDHLGVLVTKEWNFTTASS